MESTFINELNNYDPVLKYSTSFDTQHEKNVSVILYMAEKDLMITSSYDHTIRVWNMNEDDFQKKLVGILQGHTKSIYCLIKIDDNIIASGGNDCMIKLWDITRLQCTSTLYTKQNILFLLLHRKDMLIASISNTILIWDISSLSLFHSFELINTCQYCIESITDNTFILGGYPSDLLIYDISMAQIITTLQGHTEIILQIKKIEDNKVITSSEDMSIKIWDITLKLCLGTLKGHTHTIWAILLLNNKYLLSTSWDSTIKLWNIETHQLITSASIQPKNISIYSIERISPAQIAIGTKNSIVSIWNI